MYFLKYLTDCSCINILLRALAQTKQLCHIMQLSEPLLNFQDWESYQKAILKWKIRYEKLSKDQRLNKTLSRAYALSTAGLTKSEEREVINLLSHQQRTQIYTAKIASEMMSVRSRMVQKWNAVRAARKLTH